MRVEPEAGMPIRRTDAWGILHCEDGPALIDTDGKVEYRRKGQLHREDGPAIIHANGIREWWVNGILQRAENYLSSMVGCNEVDVMRTRLRILEDPQVADALLDQMFGTDDR